MTSLMSPTERAEAMARCEAATEGPWTVGDHVRIVAMAPGYFWSAQHIPHGSGPQQVPDAAFIAHVRTDYPRLEATLRAAEAERDAAQKSVIELAKHANSTIASFNTTITSLRQELKDQVFRNEAQAVEITELVAALRQITYDLDADKYRSDMRGRAYGIASESIAKAEGKS